MASNLNSTKRLIAILLSICFTAAAIPAQTARAADLPLDPQTIKFFIDPAIMPDIDFARAVLPKYVADMNAVLAKNTRRRLVFDPATGVISTPTQPQTDSAAPPLPTEGFEIWAHITKSNYVASYGGYAGLDKSGAGVLAGLYWLKIYDPDQLAPADVQDYTIQLDHMLHEMAHVFGAGIGEYYSLATVTDSTSVAPLLNINVMDPADAYWSDKPDFMVDPLLRFTHAATRLQYVSQVQYSALTAAIINGDYRNGIPSFTQYTVQVLDHSGRPVPDANVKVWSVVARAPNSSTLSFDGQTDANGQVLLDWGGNGYPHNQSNLLRLIKVYNADGAPITQPRYVSIFDADIALLVNQSSSFSVTMRPADQAPANLAVSNAKIDENQPAGTTVGSLSAVDPDAGDALSYSFCGGVDDASFQLNGADLLSAAAFDYELKSSYKVCVRADDGLGGSVQKTLTISVNDLPDTLTASFTSLGVNDGWVLESGVGSNAGGTLDAASQTSRLGNDAANRRYRSVLAFNTASLPNNAVITKVTLKIKRQGGVGADPFATFKNLTVDMGKPIIGTTAGLQSVDFQAKAGQASAALFGRKPDAKGWYAANLTAAALQPGGRTGPHAVPPRVQHERPHRCGLPIVL